MAGKLLLFWDFDAQWGADRSRRPGGADWQGGLDFDNTERLLALHAQYDVPACFAVVGAVALPGARPYHDPDQVRRIHAAGHEVASHSQHHDWLPALGPDALRATLRESKDALEQCIGAAVTAFVPPFNQPFDYPRGWSFSLSERRTVRHGGRTDLSRLCATLREVGYRFSRVAYLPMHLRVAERALGRRLYRPLRLEEIEGLTCVRINTPCGFKGEAVTMLDRVAEEGGFAVAYGHPHSLRLGGAQDERYLEPFLRHAAALVRAGRLEVVLPRALSGAAEPVETP